MGKCYTRGLSRQPEGVSIHLDIFDNVNCCASGIGLLARYPRGVQIGGRVDVPQLMR